MAYKQNLQGAQGGTIQGAHGGTQQLGAAAQRRLGAPGPNMAGGGTNPTPPTMDPAQKPPAWQALQQAGIGGQGSAAANRAAAAGLPGFQPMPRQMNTGNVMDGNPISFPGGGQPGGPMQAINIPGHNPVFGSGTQQGVGEDPNQQQQHGGVLGSGPVGWFGPGGAGVIPAGGGGGGGPLPGFTAAPGNLQEPLMSLPGPVGKFPPRPGLPTKPLPMPSPGTPQVRPGIGGGGLSPTGPRPRNNMAGY